MIDQLKSIGDLTIHLDVPTMSLEEMAWIQERERTNLEIAKVFGIPAVLLSSQADLRGELWKAQQETDPSLDLADFMTRQGIIPAMSVTSASSSLSVDDMDRLVQSIHEISLTDPPVFLISPRTYTLIRCCEHLARAYPLPHRKLRKCHMRKLYRRRSEARHRYLARGGV